MSKKNEEDKGLDNESRSTRKNENADESQGFTPQAQADPYNIAAPTQENAHSNLEYPELLPAKVLDSDPAMHNEADNIHNPDSVNTGKNVEDRKEKEKSKSKEDNKDVDGDPDATEGRNAGNSDQTKAGGGDATGNTGSF